MAYGLEISVDFSGDRELFERASKRLRRPRDLMKLIGVHAMGQAVGRLSSVLSMDSETRTGRLAASLAVSPDGTGNSDSVFELSEASVRVGTNVPYARQVQIGGVIKPATVKALAIPLVPRLARERLWPRHLDPDREVLQFVADTGSKPNIIGLLVNPEGGLEEWPAGPLYALAYRVTQDPHPFLYFDEEDGRVVNEDLVPGWLGE